MPDWKPQIRKRLAGLTLEPPRENAIVEELAQHLDDSYEALRAGGATPMEAQRQTLLELSGRELLARELRCVERQVNSEPLVLGANRRTNMIADLWQDLRFGARMLMKQPSFTLIVVLTLALGIGATTGLFSVVNAVLLRSLPYPQAEQLVQIWQGGGMGRMNMSPPELTDYRAAQQVFQALAAHSLTDANLSGSGEPERLQAATVTQDWFDVLNTPPLAGRTFLPEEHQPGQNNTVVLSYELWQRRFGGDVDVLGRTIVLNGRARTITGIMPASFRYPATAELWLPIAFSPAQLSSANRSTHYLYPIARCRDGVTLAQAQENIRAIAARFPDSGPNGMSARLVSLREELTGEVKTPLYVLFAAVGFVLLIACANVGNLLLARASARQAELALRQALGAGRARLVRQLLTESVLLAVVGGALGLLLAVWGKNALVAAMAEALPRAAEIKLDARVMIFALTVTMLSGLLFGLAPAWQAARIDFNETLKQGAQRLFSGSRQRLRGALAVAQIALALVLLIGAGLLLRSFAQLTQVNPGFNPAQVLTADLALPSTRYGDAPKQAAFYQQLTERLQTLPGVESVGLVSALPLSGRNGDRNFTHEGIPPDQQRQRPPNADYRHCSPAYFQTIGIPLKRGRAFTAQDQPGALPVAIVNETLARRLWPHEEAVGKRLALLSGHGVDPWLTIVGVVGDVKHRGLDQGVKPMIYVPHAQTPTGTMTLVLRAAGEPAALSAALREVVKTLDADLPLYHLRTLEQLRADSLTSQRFSLWLLGLFAAVALALAALGVYGVLAYAVNQRTRELGIRMALGAQANDVLGLVLRQGLRLIAWGVAIGLLAALALTRLMKALLFNVSPTDPLTFALVVLALASIALLACWIPARRATLVEPMTALRSE